MGAILTLSAIFSCLFYIYFKLMGWTEKPDIQLLSAIQEQYFSLDEPLSYEDGFFVAAAL